MREIYLKEGVRLSKNKSANDRGRLTDNALHFGHQATGRRRGGLLGEVARVEHVVHRGPMLAVVEQLIMLGIL